MSQPLVIFGHPNFTHSTYSHKFADAIKNEGFQTKILCQEYPKWEFDLTKEHDALIKSSALVFVFPIYWYSVPALLKKYVEDVLCYNWAYGENFALQNKKTLICATAGNSQEAHLQRGNNLEELLKPLRATFTYMKMEPYNFNIFFNCQDHSEAKINADILKFKQALNNL